MQRNTKRVLGVLVALAIAGAIAAYIFAAWPTATRKLADAPGVDQAAAVEAGRYVAIAGDCTACHTAPGGKPFAGGLPLASPIGLIYSTNITPDAATGIGKYTLEQFDRALRHGIAADGSTLYPAMPYPSYARLTDADVGALYAYFMHGVAPVALADRPVGIPWPLSLRWPLGIWRKLFAPGPDAVPFDVAHYPDAQVARGAYLVQGAGHCGSCHTPRGLTFQEKALDESGVAYLAGGQVVDGWFAVNLRGNPADGLGAWSSADIVASLKSARNTAHAVVGQPMNDVVVHSTQNLRDEDLLAIAAYLKTLQPAVPDTAGFKASDETAAALAAGHESGRGAELYVDNCAACHRTSGKGAPGVFPAVAGNSTVLSESPDSLIKLVLGGAELPSTKTAPSNLGMPGFGWRLSDEEAAQLLTFIRSGWGNAASAVTADQVRGIRKLLDAERDAVSADTREGASAKQ